jgi:hypothetical protein
VDIGWIALLFTIGLLSLLEVVAYMDLKPAGNTPPANRRAPSAQALENKIAADRAALRAQIERERPQPSGASGEMIAAPFIGFILAGLLLALPLAILSQVFRAFTFSHAISIVAIAGLLITFCMVGYGQKDTNRYQAEREAAIDNEFRERWRRFVVAEQEAALLHFAGRKPASPAYAGTTFGADAAWEQRVRNDAAQVQAATRQGRPAKLAAWNVDEGLSQVFTYDTMRIGSGPTVLEQRRAGRRAILDELRARIARAEDEAFEAAVNADRDRVIAAIRAGQPATLKDWTTPYD